MIGEVSGKKTLYFLAKINRSIDRLTPWCIPLKIFITSETIRRLSITVERMDERINVCVCMHVCKYTPIC